MDSDNVPYRINAMWMIVIPWVVLLQKNWLYCLSLVVRRTPISVTGENVTWTSDLGYFSPTLTRKLQHMSSTILFSRAFFLKAFPPLLGGLRTNVPGFSAVYNSTTSTYTCYTPECCSFTWCCCLWPSSRAQFLVLLWIAIQLVVFFHPSSLGSLKVLKLTQLMGSFFYLEFRFTSWSLW